MLKSEIRFSVIIPLYNKAATISATLDSVCKQNFSDFEVIVVDDGSVDGGFDIVRNYPDERIRIFSQKNSGVSAARNAGILASANPYIAFLDADDLWEPNYLESMAFFISDFTDAGLYGCAFDRRKGLISIEENIPLPVGYRGYVNDYFRLALRHHLFWTSAVVVDKNRVGHDLVFDERISLGEDLDLWFRIALKHKVAFYNQVLSHYIIDSNDRAMLRFHAFDKSILCYLAKYSGFEANRNEFSRFINHFKIIKIPELMYRYNLGKSEIIAWISAIKPEEQGFTHRAFLALPYPLMRFTLLIWKKIRGIE